MVRDAPEEFWDSPPWGIKITDASGLVLYEVYMDGITSAAGQRASPDLSRRR